MRAQGSELRPLEGRNALVTGAGRRLGAAMALTLARAGANVVVHYHRSGDEAARIVETISALGCRAWLLRADLERLEEADAVVARALQLAGRLDILINNAAIFPAGTLADMTADTLAHNVNVNALAPFLIGRRFCAQGVPGVIVNLLDARMVDYDREHASYHVSKRMLFTLTRMMALEFAPQVRVNAVAPGLILPPEGHGEDYLERLAHTNPLNRHGSANDVAEAALYLVRGEFVTGQVLFVDGGRHLRGNMYGC